MNETNQREDQKCFEVPNTKNDVLIFVSMTSVFLGLILSTIGYLVPRESTIDPALSAREQEVKDLYYHDLSNSLDICIIVGMAFIGFGGLVTSTVFCKSVVCGECGRAPNDETYTLTENIGEGEGQTYGSVHGHEGRYRTLE